MKQLSVWPDKYLVSLMIKRLKLVEWCSYVHCYATIQNVTKNQDNSTKGRYKSSSNKEAKKMTGKMEGGSVFLFRKVLFNSQSIEILSE